MSEEERIEVVNWYTKLYPTLKSPAGNKTIHTYPLKNTPNIPLTVYNIIDRIEKKENVEKIDYLKYDEKLVYKDVFFVIPQFGALQRHTDTNNEDLNLFHIRFNIFFSVPNKNLNTYYDGNIVDVQEGSYVLCRSGMDEHWTDTNYDSIPRISLSVCYLLNGEKIDNLCKNYGIYNHFYPLYKYTVKLINDIHNKKKIDIDNIKYKDINNNILNIFNNIDAMIL